MAMHCLLNCEGLPDARRADTFFSHFDTSMRFGATPFVRQLSAFTSETQFILGLSR